MPTLRFVFFVLYLAYVLSSGSSLTTSGGGLDPDGLTGTTTPTTPLGDSGGGLDPNGRT
jgi:hypothetical protein